MVTPTLVVADPIDPPKVTPPQTGLIVAADKAGRLHEHDQHDRWEIGGYVYRPVGVGKGIARVRSVLDYSDEGSDQDRAADEDVKTGDQGQIGLITGYPFLLEAEETCPAFGFNDANYQQRATDALLRLQSKLLEWEFWTGEVATLMGLDSETYQWLAQDWVAEAAGPPLVPGHGAIDITPGAGAVDPKHALALLEQALGEAGDGSGFVHLTKQMAVLTPDRWPEGPIVTWPDTYVAVGAGYPGTGPDGSDPATGESWIYATNLVDVHLGPPEIYPSMLGEALDRAKNTVSFRAQRMAAVTWDGFSHFAIRATI